MTISISNKGRNKPTMFLTFLVKSLHREKPELVNDVNYVIALHKRQKSGCKNNMAAIMTHLNTLIGEDSLCKIYFKFLRAWRVHEKFRDAMKVASTSAQTTGIVQPDGPQSKTTTIQESSNVIDITEAAVEINDSATATASADAAGKDQVHDISLLPTILISKSGNPSAASRRLNLPVHSKAQNRPESSGAFPPSIENVSPGPLQQQSRRPRYIIKQPSSQNEIRINKHVDLMSRVQRQIKEETTRSIVFVNRTLSEFESQNPQLYSQAVLVVEECLQHGKRYESGHENITAQIVQKLKALVILRESFVFRPVAPNPFDFPALQRPLPIKGWQQTTSPPAPSDHKPSQENDDKSKCESDQLLKRSCRGSDSEDSWEIKKDPTSPPGTFDEKKSLSFQGSPAWLPRSRIQIPNGSEGNRKSLPNIDSDGYSSSCSDSDLSVDEPSPINNPKNSQRAPDKILSKPQCSPSNTDVSHRASQTNGLLVRSASPRDLEPVSSTSSAAASSHPSQRSCKKRGWLASSSASSLDEEIERATRRSRICDAHPSDDAFDNSSSMNSLDDSKGYGVIDFRIRDDEMSF